MIALPVPRASDGFPGELPEPRFRVSDPVSSTLGNFRRFGSKIDLPMNKLRPPDNANIVEVPEADL